MSLAPTHHSDRRLISGAFSDALFQNENILIVTDRSVTHCELWKNLQSLYPCVYQSIHCIPESKVSFGLVIVDVCLDTANNVLFLKQLISQKNIANCPLLCLVKDKRHVTLTQAKAIGSNVVMSFNSDSVVVLETTKRLLFGADIVNNLNVDQIVCMRRAFRKAGMALVEIFNAASCGGLVSANVVLEGGDAILATIEDAGIGAWVDLVRKHDDITYQHCLLVAGLSAAFGQQLGFSINDRQLFVQATLLHDLGKSMIPPSILNKPGKLSPIEFGLIKNHPVEGHDIL